MRLPEHEFVFSYDGLAEEVGVSRSTLQRWCKRNKIVLSKWTNGRTAAVYVSKQVIPLLKSRVLASQKRKRERFVSV